MKPFVLRLMVFALLVCVNVAVKAQDPARVQMDHLDRLFPKAVETIDVTVDSGLLRLASKFLQGSQADQAAVKEILNMIKGVYVKGVEFEHENEFTTQDVETLRQQLQAPGWSRIVGVRSKRAGENVEVFMMHNGDIIQGIGVLLNDPKKLMIVNVVGPLDPEKISQLVGRFGIPNIDFDWSGVAVKTKRRDAN
ncbi:MAG: DUF4252 domain-containing protein [Acidobacteria bacterium]|nr:DUF4252 domain-containing protein [Acidobacteriota bacterium]MBI3423656.1 DUF4252 domain-containing protein [Acidobacteriota bacterium]